MSIKVTKDITKEVLGLIKSLRNEVVLVGIPDTKTNRKDSDEPTNASILALNEYGSPLNNIPARPVLTTGLLNAKEDVAKEFKAAATEIFNRGYQAVTTHYNRAGLIASTACKKVINDQEGLEPPSEATLAIRKAAGFKGTKALLVTGQLRNSITYVIRSR